ncbi:acyl-CoA N-acyltransferase [Chaetomidium leptoderma]|uniref:Acyl-CoA N-acyltransferase n=1 Tax=Chaetomidium leptoderma TaxID=669021 RepID=A0AAN6ZT85_9PEZI|nr:acyl-CoA N-acyltransferase [Chaetomidium leptoderma]
MASTTSSSPSPPEPEPAPLPKGYTLRPGYPPIPDYLHLRAASGLSPKTPAQAAPVARNSWYGCHITFSNHDNNNNNNTTPIPTEEEIVAMGRIIGDGGWYFHVADMAVLPAHQRRGLGKAVLAHLLGYIKANAPQGDGAGAYVTLFADGPGRTLYARNGFVETVPSGQLGMMLPMGWEGTLTLGR